MSRELFRHIPERIRSRQPARYFHQGLRIYEQRGLITPARTAAGWRAYGPDEMARAAETVSLRALGLSLAQIERGLKGDLQGLESALAAHQATLEGQTRKLLAAVDKICGFRDDLARGRTPTAGYLTRLLAPATALHAAFDLPWPWGGERFELCDIRPFNYITGPLGSGKTRLATRLADELPEAVFLGLERLAGGGAAILARLGGEQTLRSRVDHTLVWLLEDGATASDASTALLAGLESKGPSILVIDMLEQGLDKATQKALIAHLRRRVPGARPLFFLTRSSAILDLDAVGADEAIIFCPANHSIPLRVAPFTGSSGYEAVASCLALPEVRARTAGVIACSPRWRDSQTMHNEDRDYSWSLFDSHLYECKPVGVIGIGDVGVVGMSSYGTLRKIWTGDT